MVNKPAKTLGALLMENGSTANYSVEINIPGWSQSWPYIVRGAATRRFKGLTHSLMGNSKVASGSVFLKDAFGNVIESTVK